MKDEKISEEILALITAVAVAATGKKVEVKRISFLNPQQENRSWTLVGKVNTMSNHNNNLKG